MIRVDCRFRGRVQGVGFRYTASQIARDFAVAGWVRNEPDGSVSLVAEGEPGEIERFLDSIRERMEGLVESCDRQDGSPIGERGFEVRR